MTETVSGQGEIVIYVGTRKLVALLANVEGEEPRVLRTVETKNPSGFKGGFVTHLERASASLESLINALLPPDKASEAPD